MCLIINTPNASSVPTEYLTSAYSTNSNGFGIMFTHEGRVKTMKDMFNLNDIHNLWKKLDNRAVVAHFRFATAGIKNQDNCHPFMIFNKEEHGKDLYLMHNGTFHQLSNRDHTKSDTYLFAENFRKMALANPEFDLANPEHQEYLAKEVSYNKLVFLDDQGTVTIINKSSGQMENGNWYSNGYSIRRSTKNYGMYEYE